MRRILSIASIAIAAMLALSACAPLVPEEASEISVYATFYPLYALTDALMDGVPNASLHCLVQPQDGCLRSYTLSDWDAALLASSADAVIAGGRGLMPPACARSARSRPSHPRLTPISRRARRFAARNQRGFPRRRRSSSRSPRCSPGP